MFFNQLLQHGDALAVIEGEHRLTYRQLANQCEALCQQLAEVPQKSIFLIHLNNNISGLVAYLSCLQSGHCGLLINPRLDQKLTAKIKTKYKVVGEITTDDGVVPQIHLSKQTAVAKIDPKVAILLSTSGSTGSPKQVALSFKNLQENAQSIIEYLPMQSTDRSLCNLPMFYSYGLSLVNSHLLKGACCVFTQFTPVNREYWQLIESLQITSFAGVPHSYQMLMRLRFTSKPLPSIRYFTQAGGKLSEPLVKQLAQYAAEHAKQFFVMYGQTEATARMAYLSPQKALSKPGSIGQAIPGGQLLLQSTNGQLIKQPNVEGELIYIGYNVMLGYCANIEQMAHFEQPTRLHTGDLGYMDSEGDFYISGRSKRIIKPLGQRLALDDAERVIETQGLQAYCCGNDDKLIVALQKSTNEDSANWAQAMKIAFSRLFELHISAIEVLVFNQLPINDNGKKDYAMVMNRFQQGQLYD